VQAFKEAEAKGLGAASLEGRMIDIAVYRQAEDLLKLAEAIAEKEKENKNAPVKQWLSMARFKRNNFKNRLPTFKEGGNKAASRNQTGFAKSLRE
jgi:hypothetical protein